MHQLTLIQDLNFKGSKSNESLNGSSEINASISPVGQVS